MLQRTLLACVVCALLVMAPDGKAVPEVAMLETTTEGFKDYFTKSVREASGSAQRSIGGVKEFAEKITGITKEFTDAAAVFNQNDGEKGQYPKRVEAKADKYAELNLEKTKAFGEKTVNFAKKSLDFVGRIVPICQQACPALFPVFLESQSSGAMLEDDGPTALESQARESIWNVAGDFDSETTRYIESLKSLQAEHDTDSRNFIGYARFDRFSGRAFRRGGIDLVRDTARYTGRSLELALELQETFRNTISLQMQAAQSIGHIAKEALEVCRDCDIVAPPPKKKAL